MIPALSAARLGAIALPLAMAVTAAAQTPDYPNRPLRIIVPQAPSSGPDAMARAIGQRLTEVWGQQVIVDNRPGANGIIGIEAAAKSKPDGYTLVMGVPSSIAMNPYVYKQLPYDTFRDLAPITQAVTNTFGLLVNPVLPVKTVKELVALGRARPAEITYASFGIGNQTHLAGELFAAETRLKMTHVPYKGQTPALVDLIGGQVTIIFTPMPGAAEHVHAGRLRLIATCGESRDSVFTSVPTMREAGFPTVVITGWNGLLAPAGVPREITGRLQAEIAKYLLSPATKATLARLGADPVASTPEEFAAFIRSESQKWSRVIRQAGLEYTQ